MKCVKFLSLLIDFRTRNIEKKLYEFAFGRDHTETSVDETNERKGI